MNSALGKSPLVPYKTCMTTKKKSPAKKTTAKKSPVKKAAPKKSASRSSTKRTTVKSGRPTLKAVKKKSTSVGPRENELETNALKLVDQAAKILRDGIRTGAKTSEKSRLRAKQEAHSLLNKASTSLDDLLSGSTSILRRVINKI